MLDYQSIRNTITGSLHAVLGIPVIPQDDDGSMPAYPYVTYTATSPYIVTTGQDVERRYLSEAGYVLDSTKPVEMVYSITAYDEDDDAAAAVCMRAVEYFSRVGRETLAAAGVVVVSIGSVQNRSFWLGDHYERRWGCDVRFRVVDRSILPADYIEEAEIGGEMDEG